MDSRIEIVRYREEYKKLWDDFVESSKNGTFLFNRNYMDYHSDRFKDFSLFIYRKGKLYCLMPGNIKENSNGDIIFYSHQGLTYGGLVMSDRCSAEGVLEAFEIMLGYLKKAGVNRIIYKPVPYIYQTYPSGEDLYALFRHNAKLICRNISSTILRDDPIRLNKDRREAVRRAQKNGLYVRPTEDFDIFWKILEENLWHSYKAKPVHTLEEIKLLARRFPDNIKLWGCYSKDHKMMGGLIAYYMTTTLHAQYISATPEGKKKGAIDEIIARLIQAPKALPFELKYYFNIEIERAEDEEIKWVDLGTSNEECGKILNETLIYQKEGFGGRGVCYDTYEIDIC